MRICISLFPQEFIDTYNLADIVDGDSFIYIKIRGGMYSLPQASRLAHEELSQYFMPYRYAPVTFTLNIEVVGSSLHTSTF